MVGEKGLVPQLLSDAGGLGRSLGLVVPLLQLLKLLPQGVVLDGGDEVRAGALHVRVILLKGLQHLRDT